MREQRDMCHNNRSTQVERRRLEANFECRNKRRLNRGSFVLLYFAVFCLVCFLNCIYCIFLYAVAGAGLCDREVADSTPARGCCVPTPTQRAIPPGSVNEYQRKLGSKRAYHAMH